MYHCTYRGPLYIRIILDIQVFQRGLLIFEQNIIRKNDARVVVNNHKYKYRSDDTFYKELLIM